MSHYGELKFIKHEENNAILSDSIVYNPLLFLVLSTVTVSSMIYAGSESDPFTPQTMSGVTAVPTENVYTLNSLVSDTILNSNSNFAVTRYTATIQIMNNN